MNITNIKTFSLACKMRRNVLRNIKKIMHLTTIKFKINFKICYPKQIFETTDRINADLARRSYLQSSEA